MTLCCMELRCMEPVSYTHLIHHRLETNRAAYSRILKQKDAMEEIQQQWTWVKSLADTAAGEVGGKEKITFETYVQICLLYTSRCV